MIEGITWCGFTHEEILSMGQSQLVMLFEESDASICVRPDLHPTLTIWNILHQHLGLYNGLAYEDFDFSCKQVFLARGLLIHVESSLNQALFPPQP